MIFNYQVAPGPNAAIRAGWNDGAWGRPYRELPIVQAPWYERGYAGGLTFRQKRQCELAQRTLPPRALPGIVPSA
jgi:hypothetical protein